LNNGIFSKGWINQQGQQQMYMNNQPQQQNPGQNFGQFNNYQN
jgi:hypothetical protein